MTILAGLGLGVERVTAQISMRSGRCSAHKLRPFDKRIVAVTRKLDNDEMVWRYGFGRNRLRRLTEPALDHPATKAAAEAAQEDS